MRSMQFRSSSGPIIATTQNTINIYGRQTIYRMMMEAGSANRQFLHQQLHCQQPPNNSSSYSQDRADMTCVETSCQRFRRFRHFMLDMKALHGIHADTSCQTRRHFMVYMQIFHVRHAGTSWHTCRYFMLDMQTLHGVHADTSCQTCRHFMVYMQTLHVRHADTSFQTWRHFIYLIQQVHLKRQHEVQCI